jgi:hypothetical protein
MRSTLHTEFEIFSLTSDRISRSSVIAVNRKTPEIPIDKSISIESVAKPGIGEPVKRKNQK